MDRLFAGWRIGQPAGFGSDGRPHVDPALAPGQTLFEAIEQSGRSDEETYVLARRSRTFALLNTHERMVGGFTRDPDLRLPQDELVATTRALAERLAKGGPHALAATKQWLNELDGSLDDAIADEAAEISARVIGGDEAQSRLRAAWGR